MLLGVLNKKTRYCGKSLFFNASKDFMNDFFKTTPVHGIKLLQVFDELKDIDLTSDGHYLSELMIISKHMKLSPAGIQMCQDVDFVY